MAPPPPARMNRVRFFYCAILSLGAAPAALGQTLTTRNPATWPFSSGSPWNTGIGSKAKFKVINLSGSGISWANFSVGINVFQYTVQIVNTNVTSPNYTVSLYDNTNLTSNSPYNNYVYYTQNASLQNHEFCYVTNPNDVSSFLSAAIYPNPSQPSSFHYVGNQWATTYNAPVTDPPPNNATPYTPTNTVPITNNYSQTFLMPANLCGSPDGDGLMSVIQPNNFAVDLYAPIILPNTTPKIVLAHAVGSYYDLTGDGTGYWNGRRASMLPTLAGLIRTGELAGGSIPHAVSVVISPTALSDVNGPAWPAYTFDTNDGYANCAGCLPMGALLAIPPSVDVSTLGLTPAGLTLATAAQKYGIYIVDRGGSGGMTFLAELNNPDTMPTTADLQAIRAKLKQLANNTPTTIGGGGTPDAPSAPPFGN